VLTRQGNMLVHFFLWILSFTSFYIAHLRTLHIHIHWDYPNVIIYTSYTHAHMGAVDT